MTDNFDSNKPDVELHTSSINKMSDIQNYSSREPNRILNFDNNGEFKDPANEEGGVAFDSNKIRTSKYTWWSFVFKNLFEQVTRPANAYFCGIAVLQSIPQVSISQGNPTILLPLVIVFTVTAIKDVLEDIKRHKSDKLENEQMVEVLQPNGKYESFMSENIKVGDIVRIHESQRFPADLLLITSDKGHKVPYCYVETSNIDGETNLKLKQSPEGLNSLVSFDTIQMNSNRSVRNIEKANVQSYNEFKKRIKRSILDIDPPDGHLDQWSGMIKNIKVPKLDDDDNSSTKDNIFSIELDNIDYENKNVLLGIDNLLLRGSNLKNTEWIYGLVVYTGFECKIFMNSQSKKARPLKRSTVEKRMNKFIMTMAGFQALICIMCAILSGIWLTENNNAWYLDYNIDPELGAFYKFFTWFIIFAQFIPISLLVSMEMVKYFQAQWMQWDINMYIRLRNGEDKFCDVQNSGLNEDLGQIQYVFSDKTGTLTDNSLDFRKCVIGSEIYGRGETEIGRAAKRRENELKLINNNNNINNTNSSQSSDTNETSEMIPTMARMYTAPRKLKEERKQNVDHVNFDETERLHSYLNNAYSSKKPDKQSILVKRFLRVLALNNSCYPVEDEETKELLIRAASPDDECLTCFARYMHVELVERNPPNVTLNIYPELNNKINKIQEKYEQLAELEFTSKRKCMSVILRNLETNKIHFTLKGADSIMIKLLHEYDKHPNKTFNDKWLNSYAEEGLRTLLVGESILNSDWWDNPKTGWSKKYEKFLENTLIPDENEKGHLKGACQDRCRKCNFYREIELDAKCELLGVTAIEDKLQQSVPETISAMLDGNIRVWVLTGDKQSTAENIGVACNLLDPIMEKNELLFRLTSKDVSELDKLMHKAINRIKEFRSNDDYTPCGLVVNSVALKLIMESDNSELIDQFITLAQSCKSVLGVRLQPNQKAQVVKLVKDRTNCVCLAVGDGANDEPMIRTADIGVGIAGVEGTAAVRASDYAIGQFKFLKRLIFVHGRLHYRRVTTLICFIFYKNGIFSLASFWFGLFNGFSGQISILEWAYQLYNVVFTALPIMIYAVFETDFNANYLINHPQLYTLTQNGQLFNAKIFFSWIIDAIFESCILALIPFFCYSPTTSDNNNGQSVGIWTYGLCAYTGIVFCANLRLSFITTNWTFWMHFSLWGSVVAFFFCIIILNLSTFFANAGADYYFLVFRMMGTYKYWLTAILSSILALFIPFSYVSFTQLRIIAQKNRSILRENNPPLKKL